MKKEYLSMADASKLCPYEKGYLSLLARRKELRAEKIGRNWYTKVQWLNEYLAEKRPNDIIEQKEESLAVFTDELNNKEKSFFKATWIWLSLTTLTLLAVFFIYGKITKKVNEMQKKTDQFVTNEIVKIPDEQGNFDVYSKGVINLGKEKNN